MKLSIQNFAKIHSAELELNGITVIAGNNNTGKSTVGKILFSIFYAFHELNNKIRSNRFNSYNDVIKKYTNTFSSIGQNRNVSEKLNDEYTTTTLVNSLIDGKTSLEEFIDSLTRDKFSKDKNPDFLNSALREQIYQELKKLTESTDQEIAAKLVEEVFRDTFDEQIEPLGYSDTDVTPKVVLKFSDQVKIVYNYDYGRTPVRSDIPVINQAHYIATPYVMDLISDFLRSNRYHSDLEGEMEYLKRYSSGRCTTIERSLLETFYHAKKDIPLQISIEKTLGKILDKIDLILPGKIHKYYEDGMVLDVKNFSKPLRIKNLSTGLKSFALLKLMLDCGVLKNNDVLILDEPEIHLHPEWQLIYAEIIVLLQKEFGLTILLTSHSPFFLDAIQLYSKKNHIYDRVAAYVSEITKDSQVTMTRVKGDNWDQLYRRFLFPMQQLKSMREELFDEEDEDD